MPDRRLLLCTFAVLVATTASKAQAPPDKGLLAEQARRVLESHCSRCHKGPGSEGGDANFLLRADLVAVREGEKPYVVPGKPAESFLYQRMAVRKGGKGDMPPSAIPERPADADKAIIQKWIEAGAPDFPVERPRSFISLETTLTLIRDDLNKADRADRPYLRYFTLTHLHNNPTVRADHLPLVRAALAKVLNSLSWENDIAPLRAIDADQTVLAIDLRKLGWSRDLWQLVLQAYPYGLSYESHDNDKLRKLDQDIHLYNKSTELVYLRADWFVATASRPPLYHQLLYDLYLPELKKRTTDPKNTDNPKHMTAVDLEEYLKIDARANIEARDPKVKRAGFARSGVSGQNRLIERHPIKGGGAYWKSYDFKATTWEANLLQFPLGPRSASNPFPDLAFAHDGGEIIFNLPNGLQGYLLVNGKDERIDAGPIEVVSDALKTAGTAAIVNGLSCMACHKNGMITPPADFVREGRGVFGQPRERVLQLYPPTKEMAKVIREDSERFLKSVEPAMGAFLKVGAEKERELKDFEEPVGEVARKYLLEDLNLVAVACELSEENPQKLKQRIAESDDLKRLGLGALTQDGGLIKRGAWESLRGTSQMQQAARELGFTTINVSRSR